MMRDLTVILSVLVAVVSIGFGLYKNIEANNARGFAYAQAFRMLNAVQRADIATATKVTITNDALGALSTPPPVIDLSRSSAAILSQSCTADQQATCLDLASQLANANATCIQSRRVDPASCPAAQTLLNQVVTSGCFTCFSQ